MVQQPTISEQRSRWLRHLLLVNDGYVQVAKADTSGTPRIWYHTTSRVDYDFRVVVNHGRYAEVVFDVDHHSTEDSWRWVRRDAILLGQALEKFGVPYLPALSGGNGFHIHVLLDSGTPLASPNRKAFAEEILRHANESIDPFTGEPSVSTDPVGYDKDTQVFREFGSWKRWPKTAWRRPLGTLPATREDAYVLAEGSPIPRAMPVYRVPLRAHAFNDGIGPRCPTERYGVSCEDAPCDGCPLGR